MLKLFGKSRKTPEIVKDESTTESKTLAPAKIRGLKPPTNSNLLAPTTTTEKTNVQQMSKTETSKSSEEDSGFGNSTAVSLNSSNSSLASGSNGVRQQSVPPLSHPETIEEVESIAEDSGICSDATTTIKNNAQSSNSPQLNCRKPTLAVKAITVPAKRSLSSEKPSRLKTMIDTNARIESNQQAQPSLTPATQSMDEEKKSLKKPTVPVRKTSRLQSAESENLDEIPPMPQLRISTTMDEEKLRNVPVSAESISNDAAYINIRKSTESNNFQNEEFALDFGSKLNKMPKIKQLGKPPPSSPKTIEMHRTMRMNCRRRDYVADSCEDSSSISSGISDNNFEDVSTDDLTGSSLSDHQMTAASYGEYRKAGVEIGRPRTSAGISSATSNLSILEPQRLHQRRMVEQQQNVVEELLQKSRTSQRSVAFTPNTGSSTEYERVYHTVHGPSTASPNRFGPSNSTQLLLSQDGQTLSISRPSARPSLRTVANQYPQAYQAANHHASAVNSQQSNNYNTHSLDRHAHLKQFVNPNSELIYDSLGGQVPYRISASKPPSQHSSIYAAASEYSIGHSPTGRHQYAGYDMLGQQRRSNGSLSARLPNNNEFGLNLHKLSSELSSPRTHLRMSTTNGTLANGGSQLSLTSSLGSAYSASEDAYETLIRRLNDEMSSCRTKLKTVDKDDLQSIIHVFDNKLEVLVKQVEKLQKKSAKANDVENLMSQIEDLRRLSVNARLAVSGQPSGRSHSIEAPTDGMKRQPSVESVNSCYTSTKGGKEKGSASGFGRNAKKGWIRSSFTRAFHKGKKSKNGSMSECEQSPLHRSNLKTIAGSTTTLDSNDDHLVVLKKQLQETEKQLQETEKQLGNFQLEALDKAREVDILQNTVNRLKNENKFLKHTTIMLERKAMRSESRASSRQSLTCCHEEDGFYEQTPSIAERSCSSTSSSKRSSGGLNARVVVNIDVSGALTFTQNAQELNIGSIPLPSAQTSWTDVDTLLGALVEEYMRRVDPEMKLQLSNGDACIIGYQLPDGQMRDRLSGKAPTQQPSELITPTSLIRLKLCGSAQNSMDSLCLESLFPKEILQKLLNLLLASHRLVINGSTGIGKSGLARYLGRYLAAQRGISTNQIKNIMFPNDESDQRFVQVQQELETLLKSSEESIILIDNIHRRRVESICEAFAAADEYYASNLNESASVNPARGPFVIITLNRTSDLQLQQMQITYNVRAFSLYCQLEPIKGFLGRYLRRRIAQDEFTGNCRCGDQLQCVIEFLSRTLEAVNNFIKDLNALDTIGPRIFLQCPLSMEASREWFIQLWNSNIVVYMARIVRDSNSTIEWKDPTQFVAEIWPWLDGVGGESVLHTVSFELDKPSSRNSSSTSSVGGIDVLNELDRIAESNRVYQSGKYSSQQLQVRP
ncbi:Adapter protein unc-53 [Aphelenchoides bicaudatus]|nr:Adapter protein unc-53 [Aphelenchoides bicaudatus]